MNANLVKSEEEDKTTTNTTESETKALDNLLCCSKRAEKLEKTVSTKDWDAVSVWSNTRPMCRYVDHATSNNKKKDKKKTKHVNNSFNHHSQLNSSKNNECDNATLSFGKWNESKKLKVFSKEKCKHYEIPLIKETLTDDYSKSSNFLVRNKFSRSTNVLSYDTPSWRFLVDSKDFEYIERSTPKEKSCSFMKRKKSMAMNNQSFNKGTKQHILDPAGFLDDQIMIAYKCYRTFQPNLEIRQLLKKIDNINKQIKHNRIEDRLYVTSFIKKLNPICDGESDGNEGSTLKKPEKARPKKLRKKIKKKVKKKPTSGSRNLNLQKFVLPKIDTTISNGKSAHLMKPPLTEKETKDIKKGPTVNYKEELYLPLFNHSNYANKLQYLKRADVKLPAVSGIKISLSATSNSGLVS